MTSQRPGNRRGFAMGFAIALLGLVATAIVLLTRQVGYEIRRTILAGEDAQLRQLLLAGAWSAQAHAASWGDSPRPESWTVELPASLVENKESLSITCQSASDGEVDAEVTARLGSRQAIQTLRFKRSAQRWSVREARWNR